tara:strand:+ start:395 stop:724 length:330 start_codon:yes stop_codon:yes gene_type:complete
MSKKEGLKQKKLYNEVVGLMTRPSDYQSFIDSYRNRPNYYRTAKYKLEIQDTKRKSIAFRNNILKNREKSNYQNEYDRLRGIIAHTVVPVETKDRIEQRLKYIEDFKIA